MLKTRIITALVLLPLMLAALFFFPPAAWAAFSWLIIVLAMWEYARMAAIRGMQQWLYLGGSTLLAAAAWFSGFVPDGTMMVISLLVWLVLAPLWLRKRWAIPGGVPAMVLGWLLMFPAWFAFLAWHPDSSAVSGKQIHYLLPLLPALLLALQAEPFLALPPPKSTGRDLFHPQWLQQRLHAAPAAPPADVQATLAELTASACAASAKSYENESKLLIVCGGGAHNGHLMRRLSALLPGWAVESSAQHGLPPLQVEAAAFAWLAQRCMNGLAGNLPRVTGAAGPRILGAIYPA